MTRIAVSVLVLGGLVVTDLEAQRRPGERGEPGVRSSVEPRDLAPASTRSDTSGRRPTTRESEEPAEQPPDRGPATCGGDSICADEVDAIVTAAAMSLDTDNMTIAVVDRTGGVLALFRKPGADPANDDVAAGVARTAAFFSNNFAPLTSRTVRSLSGVNFPIGVKNVGSGGLYSIEQSNRGCDLNVTFNPGQEIPTSRSIEGLRNDIPCNPTNTTGCGPGLLTGKASPFEQIATAVPINPAGVPIFRMNDTGTASPPTFAVGAIGVAGPPPDQAEYASFIGALSDGRTLPAPVIPLPPPGNVFIDGIRLPFVKQQTQPEGTSPDAALRGSYDPDFTPRNGLPPPEGYLVGPLDGQKLTAEEVDRIVRQSDESANRTRAQVRLPLGQTSRMVIAISDLDGTLLALYRQPDALFDAVDVCPGKARAVVFYSGEGSARLRGVPPGIAITTRALGFGAQIAFPSGQENDKGPGPFFEDVYVPDFQNFCTIGDQGPANPNQNGISFIPGGIPLYKGTELVGGLGVSGDGVEQDDIVAFEGAFGFLPPETIWADTVQIDGVRLPFLKFPRQPNPRGLND